MEVKVDTQKLLEAGSDIKMLANDFANVIEEMFNRISSMTSITGEWLGKSAKEYEKQAKIDKEMYVVAKDEIYLLGKKLCDIAEDYDKTIKGNEY